MADDAIADMKSRGSTLRVQLAYSNASGGSSFGQYKSGEAPAGAGRGKFGGFGGGGGSGN